MEWLRAAFAGLLAGGFGLVATSGALMTGCAVDYWRRSDMGMVLLLAACALVAFAAAVCLLVAALVVLGA